MKLLDTGDAQIAYEDEGAGDAILLLHGGLSSNWFVPVGRRLVADGYRVLRTHRAGSGQSRDVAGHLTLADHAGHAAGVLEDAGVRRAHVVGHSAGGSVALELTHARPDLVRSLVLLEAAFPYAPDEPKSPAMPLAVEAARGGDYEGALDLFLGAVSGSGFREVFRREIGDEWLPDAVAGTKYFFTTEAAAHAAWPFGSAQAATVDVPVLLVVGGEGERRDTPHRARSAQLASWLPHSETRMLPDVSHSMPLEDPALVAGTIETFVARHSA